MGTGFLRRVHSEIKRGRTPQNLERLGRFFIEEPETNWVAERFNRTLKEQAIYGRIYRNLEEVRAAVGEFIERYNLHWRLEKLGYQTPFEARKEHELRQAA